MEKCACVVLNYNDWQTTLDFVTRIRGYNSIGEVIIVDNCSTDDSFLKLKEIAADNVFLYKTERNGGYGYGNNYGARKASEHGYKHILISNPDVFFSDKTVTALSEALSENPQVAVTTGIQYDIRGKQIVHPYWDIPNKLEATLYTTKVMRWIVDNRVKSTLANQNGSIYVDCVPGALLLVDAEKFFHAGGYDERVFLFCEEVILAKRVENAGYKTMLLLSERYDHLHSVSINKSITSIQQKMRLVENSRLFFMREYLHASKWLLMLAKQLFEFDIWRSSIKAEKTT